MLTETMGPSTRRHPVMQQGGHDVLARASFCKPFQDRVLCTPCS